jgi:HlyD family secretion protein
MVREVRVLGAITSPTEVELNMRDGSTEVRPGHLVDIFTPGPDVLRGRVIRVDVMSGTVTVRHLQSTKFARGTSVDGRIELERLSDVLHVGRPVSANPNTEGEVFKVDADGLHASKVRVRFGRSSTNIIEILKGFKVGDRVVVGDLDLGRHQRIELK